MPRLVEDAGEVLSAGWLSRFVRATRLDAGVVDVSEREVEWVLGEDAVTVTHTSPNVRGELLSYSLGLIYTTLPSLGLRWWWSCPACQARVDTLYLPLDRDRLACRRCCGLHYRSQYGRTKICRRQRTPVVVIMRERMEWTAASGGVLLSRKRVQR